MSHDHSQAHYCEEAAGFDPVLFRALPVGEVKRNEAGQIYIVQLDGTSFDMSKYVGHTLYIKEPK